LELRSNICAMNRIPACFSFCPAFNAGGHTGCVQKTFLSF
jgi:hypothetical protein